MSIDWRIETFDTLGSTQAQARAQAVSGVPEGLVIQAFAQTDGKGRHGREWVSPEGNLYLSVLLRPDCDARKIGVFSLVAALAVADAVGEYLEDTQILAFKWPNDVMLGGKKCAGILLETGLSDNNKVEWLLIGIGLNIGTAPDIGAALKDYAGNCPDLADIRDSLLKYLVVYRELWKTKGFNEIRMLWLKHAHRPGAALQIKLGEKLMQGYFHDMDGHGNLLLELDGGGIQVITAGDVYVIGD